MTQDLTSFQFSSVQILQWESPKVSGVCTAFFGDEITVVFTTEVYGTLGQLTSGFRLEWVAENPFLGVGDVISREQHTGATGRAALSKQAHLTIRFLWVHVSDCDKFDKSEEKK